MKNEKSYTFNRKSRFNKFELPKNDKPVSPKIELKYSKNKTPKKEEPYQKDLLENTKKYLEMSNGNFNYLISPISPKNDYSSKFLSPSLISEEYDINKKYNNMDNDNDDSLNFIQDDLDTQSGNDRLHRVKDEYIEYLQRQLDENNKNVIMLEMKLNELQKKFKNLIDDNRLLNEALTEKGNKLNEFIIENENLRLQINNYIDNETKYKLQLQYYEKQIELYETNINEYNNIITDLKYSNEKLSNNLTENLENNNDDKNKRMNNNYNMTNSNNFNNYNYFNVRNINNNEGELNLLKNQNMIYENDIKSKDYTIDLITKKNDKLMSENKIYKTQIQQYAQQISNLYNILKQKNKTISTFRQKEGVQENPMDAEYEKKLEELNMNFINNNELLLNLSKDDIINTKYDYDNNSNNDRLTQFINNNENNKKRIDILNNKIKSLNPEENINIKNNNDSVLNNGNINNNNNNFSRRLKYRKANNISSPKIENGETTIQYGNSWRILISPKKSHNNEIEKVDMIDLKNKVKQEKIIVPRNLLKDESNKEVEEKKNNNKDKHIRFKGILDEKTDINDKHIKFKGILDQKEEIKETAKEIGRKKHNSHVPKVKKKFKISDFLDITEINTSSPVAPQNLSFSMDDTEYINNLLKSNHSNSICLFGIDRDHYFYIFDIKDKKLTKKKILEIEDISDTFQKDYQYEGTILYNTLDGLFILTGKKSDILYHYNSKYDTINKICKFNNSHDNGNLLLDKEYNRLFVFGGKKTRSCEYYSFNDKKIYSIPDLTIDRANASFILCNNKIYGFFGFSYKNDNYCGNIEFIDNTKLDRWSEIKNITKLNENINFEVESVSTIIYKEDNNKILLYAGIQGDNEDYVIDNYYLYDTKNNTIDSIEKWNNKTMKYVGSRWRYSKLSKKDPAGYHFAKNSNFLKLPKSVNIEGYNNDIYLLMDYKNNIHFIDQDEKTIEIFISDL